MRHAPVCSQSGFTLIAVIVFVLIISMIGLTIFTMGGFEADFVGEQIRHERAYFAAKGALIRARAVLETTQSKDAVRQNPPDSLGEVLSCVAIQNGDSIGSVVWNPSQQIDLRVQVRVGNQVRSLGALYEPLSVGQQAWGVIANRGVTRILSPGTVKLNGPVRQASNDLAWLNQLNPGAVTRPVTISDIQPLDIYSFIQAHQWAPAFSWKGGGNYTMDGGFYLSDDNGIDDWSFYDNSKTPEITVTGTNVWLVEKGLFFEKGAVQFKNGGYPVDPTKPPGRLVIVAMKGPGDIGARFRHGIEFSQIPIAIVSDGKVAIGEAATVQTTVNQISIFADGLDLSYVVLNYDPPAMDPIMSGFQRANPPQYPSAMPGVYGVLSPVEGGWTDYTYPIN